MTYNSKTYWANRDNPNRKDAKPNAIESILREGVTGNVLDFGCGVGRTFELYENASDVIGLDFVDTYRQRAMENAVGMPWGFYHTIHDVHVSNLPWPDGTFETGVLCAVLLHAPPDEAKRIIEEMGRVCRKVCVVSYLDNGQKLADHVFAHDYNQLMRDTGMTVNHRTTNKELNQLYFEYEKNRKHGNHAGT